MGQPQISDRQPRPEPEADGPRLCRHLLFAPGRPQDAARGDDGRARPASAPARRSMSASRPTSQRTRKAQRSSRESACRCSSTSRAIRCSTAGSRRGLLDTLEGLGVGCIVFSPLAQGMLTDEISRRHSRGSRAAQGKSLRRLPHRGDAGEHPRPERHRRAARPDAGADGAGLGAARRPGHHGADRRQPTRAGRGLRGRARETPTSATPNSPRSTAMPATPTSTCGLPRPSARVRHANSGRSAGKGPQAGAFASAP